MLEKGLGFATRKLLCNVCSNSCIFNLIPQSNIFQRLEEILTPQVQVKMQAKKIILEAYGIFPYVICIPAWYKSEWGLINAEHNLTFLMD